MYWQPKGLPVLPTTPAPHLGRTPISATPAQDMLLSNAWTPNPAGVHVKVAEVVHCRGETGALEPPLTLAAGELFTLNLPLDKVELGLEALNLLIMTAVSLD